MYENLDVRLEYPNNKNIKQPITFHYVFLLLERKEIDWLPHRSSRTILRAEFSSR